MNRFISFLTGFLLATICGSLFVLEFKPRVPSLYALGYEGSFETKPVMAAVDEKLARVLELFEETTSKLTQTVSSWEGIDLSRVLSRSNTQTASFATLFNLDEARVNADVAALALAHGSLVSEVVFDDQLGWTVLLESEERVLLGEEEIGRRLHRALTLIASLPQTGDASTQVIDARFVLGVAISSEQPTVALH